jgi:hypothetical protein
MKSTAAFSGIVINSGKLMMMSAKTLDTGCDRNAFSEDIKGEMFG